MSDASPAVHASDSRTLEPVPRTRGAKKAELIGESEGAPHFAKRKFLLEPGARIPTHRHPDIEHEQYVLAGEIALGLGGEIEIVGEGDVVFIPAETPHWYENRTEEPAAFLCTVPITEEYRTEWLEEPPEGAHPESPQGSTR